MQIRPARKGDGTAVLDLIQCLADYEKLPGPTEAARARFLADAFSSEGPLELWVAEVEGIVVAYAAWFLTYSTFLARRSLYLEDLFVHPDARRRGVGAAMMAALRDEAGRRGCGRFEWSVLDWNENAQTFYEGLGASFIEGWKLMRVVLEPDR